MRLTGVCRVEMRVAQQGLFEVCTAKVGTAKIRAAAVGFTSQAGSEATRRTGSLGKGCAAEVRALERSFDKPAFTEVGAGKIGASKVSAIEPALHETGLEHGCLTQLDVPEVCRKKHRTVEVGHPVTVFGSPSVPGGNAAS
jgi:hypothetical protein